MMDRPKENSLRFSNEIDKPFTIYWVALCFIGYLFGPLISEFGRYPYTLIAAFAIATFGLVVIFYREYYHRPILIEVGREGFILKYRFKSDSTRGWSDIEWLRVVPENPKTSKKKYDSSMYLKLRKELPFPLTWEAAKAIENNYIKKMGSKPPWD
ncbi:MAG: hypothetical protein ACTSX2_04425 [Candidatus Thorarchaeota archaeon]